MKDQAGGHTGGDARRRRADRERQVVGKPLFRLAVARVDRLKRCGRNREAPGGMDDDGDHLPVLRSPRVGERLAFVAEQFELCEHRKLEVIDRADALANVQRDDHMEGLVDLRLHRVRR